MNFGINKRGKVDKHSLLKVKMIKLGIMAQGHNHPDGKDGNGLVALLPAIPLSKNQTLR